MERIHCLFDKNAWKNRIPMVTRNIWGEKALAIPALSYCYAAYMRFFVDLDEKSVNSWTAWFTAASPSGPSGLHFGWSSAGC